MAMGAPEVLVAATDYAMCNGAIPLLCGSSQELSYPVLLSGYYGPNSKTRVKDVRDGTSLTFAMGEVAGGEHVIGSDNTVLFQPPDTTAWNFGGAKDRPWGIDQAWGVARIEGYRSGWPRGSIFISAFQHVGTDLQVQGDTITEMPAPMNPRWVMSSVIDTARAALPPLVGAGTTGPCANTTTSGDRLSNVRSQHEGGSQFLMGDGTVRFVSENVDRKIYGYLFTVQGKEIVDEDDF
jgi:hypothetical protein